MTAQGHTGKAYHRFWAQGRSLGKDEARVVDEPSGFDWFVLLLGAMFFLAVLAVAVWLGLYALSGVARFYYNQQNEHAEWCAQYGGKISVGAFGSITCYDLTPKKKGE